MSRIMVADDEENIRYLLRKMLTAEGYEVLEAGGGNEVMSKMQGNEPEILIIDIIMPDKGGIETIMELQAEYPKLKFIIITGKVSTETAVLQKLANQFGVKHIISKPFTKEQIIEAIKDCKSR